MCTNLSIPGVLSHGYHLILSNPILSNPSLSNKKFICPISSKIFSLISMECLVSCLGILMVLSTENLFYIEFSMATADAQIYWQCHDRSCSGRAITDSITHSFYHCLTINFYLLQHSCIITPMLSETIV